MCTHHQSWVHIVFRCVCVCINCEREKSMCHIMHKRLTTMFPIQMQMHHPIIKLMDTLFPPFSLSVYRKDFCKSKQTTFVDDRNGYHLFIFHILWMADWIVRLRLRFNEPFFLLSSNMAESIWNCYVPKIYIHRATPKIFGIYRAKIEQQQCHEKRKLRDKRRDEVDSMWFRLIM